MSQVGMEQNKEHLQELVQGNKDSKFIVGFAGSPVNHNIAEELVMDIYGGTEGIQSHLNNQKATVNDVFRSQVNPQDTVGSFLGWQSAGINNSEQLGTNVWNSLLSVPMLFGVGGDSSHSYYPCVIGCGNNNITPKFDYYYDPKANDIQSPLTQYYTVQLPHVDQSLLPQSQQTTKIGSKEVMINTAEGQQ